MRVISGILKARRFSVPKGFPSRPTTDFAKEGLFNILEHQIDLFDLEILDLCSGTGNITFEFLSREAGHVTAVDSNFKCIRFIRKSAKDFGIEEQMNTVQSDILQFLDRTDHSFDIIFADPPYDYPYHALIAEKVFSNGLLNKDGLLIIEHGRNTDLSGITHFQFSRTYGNVHFSFFRIEDKQ